MKEKIQSFVEAVIKASKTPDQLRAVLPHLREMLVHFGMNQEELHYQMLELEAIADSWEQALYSEHLWEQMQEAQWFDPH